MPRYIDVLSAQEKKALADVRAAQKKLHKINARVHTLETKEGDLTANTRLLQDKIDGLVRTINHPQALAAKAKEQKRRDKRQAKIDADLRAGYENASDKAVRGDADLAAQAYKANKPERYDVSIYVVTQAVPPRGNRHDVYHVRMNWENRTGVIAQRNTLNEAYQLARSISTLTHQGHINVCRVQNIRDILTGKGEEILETMEGH